MSSTLLIKPSTKGNELQKVLQSKGDVGVPKVTKKSPTKPQGFNLSSAKKRKDSPNVELSTQKSIKTQLIQTPKFAKMTKPEISKNQENLKPKTPSTLSLKKNDTISKQVSIPKPLVQKTGKNPIPKIPVFTSVSKPKPSEKSKVNIKVPNSPQSPILSVETLKLRLKEAEEKVMEQQKEIENFKMKNLDLEKEIESLKNEKKEMVVEEEKNINVELQIVEEEKNINVELQIVEEEKNINVELFPKENSIILDKVEEEDDFVHSPFGSENIQDDLKENQPPIEAFEMMKKIEKRTDQKERVVLAEKTDYEIDKRDDIIVEEEDNVPEKEIVEKKQEIQVEEVVEKKDEIVEKNDEIVERESIVDEKTEERKEIEEKKDEEIKKEEFEKNVDNEEEKGEPVVLSSPKSYQTPKRKRQRTLRKKNQNTLEEEN